MFKFSSLISSLILASVACAGVAQAGLVGVKDIRVTSGSGDNNIQVVELQAFESNSGNNVALSSLGTVATASSTYAYSGNANPGKAIDGQFADQTFPNMWHSGGQAAGDWLNISFGTAKELSSLTMYGRSDCCSNRDIFNVGFYGVSGDLLYTAVVNAFNNQHVGSIELPNTAVAAIPEPASIALLGLGMLGLGLSRRKHAAK